MSKTEINKYLKELSKAERDPNKLKECAELCNYIGDLHSEKRHYEDAIYYHAKALEYSEKDGDKMAMALANRCLGECYSANSEFKTAEQHIKQYNKIVQNLGKKPEHFIEMQRARTTLARLYLTQAQELMENDLQETDEFKRALDNAEKSFTKADEMANFLSKNFQKYLPEKEYPEMKARLLLNLALVKDMQGNFKEATLNLRRSIDICEEHKLKEDLYLSQFNLASIYRQHGHEDCMKLLEAAIATAKHLRTSKSKLYICDAYIQKGLVLLEKRAFQKDEAMKCFYLAYEEQHKDETRCDEDLQRSIKLLKLSYMIYTNYNRLQNPSLTSFDFMEIYDKLGDCFTELKMFKMAIIYYQHALERARSCNRPSAEIAAIYTSLAESYADSEQYEKAIEHYEKELNCWKGDNAEQSRTLVKIAQMKEYMKASCESVIDAYENAYNIARDNPALEHHVLKFFVPYLSTNDSGSTLHRKYEEILKNCSPMLEENLELGEEPSVADDICLDDILEELQDDYDDEEGFKYLGASGRTKRTTARCSKKFKVNDFGETPLHQACIRGDKKAVERLLDSNHPINPVENSGWTPIHEAAINGHAEIVDILIQRGAKINFRGHKGITPLHDAALNGHYTIIELLLKNQANCIALDDDGNTPLDHLMKYYRDNKSEMTNSQLSEWTQTKSSLEHAMNQAGFDFKGHMINRIVGSSTRKRQSTDVTTKTAATTINRHRDLADDPPPNPVKEYRTAITDLRRTTTTKKHTVPSKPSDATTSLGALTLKADIKDWMIDDVSGNKRGRKKYCRSGLEDDEDLEEADEQQERDVEMDEIELLDDNIYQNQREVLSDDEDFNVIKHQRNQSKRKRLNSPVFSDDDDVGFGTSIRADRMSDKNSKSSRDPISSYIITRDEVADKNPKSSRDPISSYITRDDTSSITSASSNDKRSIKVEIESSTMPIQVDPSVNVQWLIDQVTERYMSFLKLTIRPTIELYAENEDFPLYCKDIVQDVVHGKLKAVIKSWNLLPLVDRYIKACKEDGVKPMEPPSQLCAKLVNAQKCKRIDMSYCRIPHAHVLPLIRSWKRDEVNQMNLSASNICIDDERGVLFSDILSTLHNLTKLSLSCCGLDDRAFAVLCKSKLSKVTDINISYNDISCQTDDFLQSLDELSKNACNIQTLDVRWNNYDKSLNYDRLNHRYKFKIVFDDQQL